MEPADLIEVITLGLSGLPWAECFRRKRVHLLTSADSPIRLISGCTLFVHIVPYQHRQPISFRGNKHLDVVREHLTLETLSRFAYNSDGFLHYASGGQGHISSYFLCMRLGLIELCTVYETNERKFIPGRFMDLFLLQGIKGSINSLVDLEQNYPMVVLVTLVGAKGWIIAGAHRTIPIDRDKVWIEGTCLEKEPEDWERSLTPLLDAIWNSTGVAKSPNV
jgi:hypothetical protein